MEREKRFPKQERELPLWRPINKNALAEFSIDPQGSYTGVPADRYDTPVQDADDL